MKNKKRRLFVIVILIITLIPFCANISAKVIYYNSFNVTKTPDYSLVFGMVSHDRYNSLPREIVSYNIDKETIQGYFYKANESKKLVVICHGFNDGADSLLPVCDFFFNNGYNVFSYDAIGCFSSSGKIYGFHQFLVSLEGTMNFLNSNALFANYEKYIFGFSAGGYATMSYLNISSKNIMACVSVSGFNNANDIIYLKGKEHVGFLANVFKNTIDSINKKHFKDYLTYSANSGINNSNTPCFIANSKDDEIITYNSMSIAASEITSKNVKYYIGEKQSHTGILYSDQANLYRNKMDEKFQNALTKKEKRQLVSSADHKLYSELNPQLFEEILVFFNDY